LTYLSTVLADAPVHYWRMAEAGGWLAHDIGSARVHLASGYNSQLGYTGVANSSGSAFTAGGSGFETLDVVSQARPLTIELWVWPIYRAGVIESLFYWDGAGANSAFMYSDAAGKVNLGGTGVTLLTSGAALATQAWHHLAGVYAAGATTLYVDGVNVAANATQVTTPVNRRLGLGMQPADGQVWTGFIAEAAVYAAALTALRVAAHFGAQEITQPPNFNLGGQPGGPAGLPAETGLNPAIYAAVHRDFPATS
jgi:hypothetical protein